MKAVTYTRYGSPEVLTLTEVPHPEPQANEVLIRVHATPVTTVDSIFRKGEQVFARLYTGLRRPKHAVLGALFSGEIVAAGPNVTRFSIGDAVYGANDFGAHAAYLCLPEDAAMVVKPEAVTHEEAAAIVEGALTALPFLRDTGRLQPGQRVLINGASGSVGTAAVQLAKHLGAHVTGVCSGRNAELVRGLGADRVIDYTQEDFTQMDERYDLIFDTIGKSSFRQAKRALTPHGVFLSPVISGTILWQMAWTSMRPGKKARFAATGTRPAPKRTEDLELISHLLTTGHLTAVIDRTYPMEDVIDAHHYVDSGRKRGNVVLRMVS